MGIRGFIESNIYAQLILHPIRTLRRIRVALIVEGNFEEIFARQGYLWLLKRLKPDTTLVDIGATVGDTALYFSMSPNVDKVVSFEPSPVLYSKALYYIALSPDKKKIEFNNMAVTSDGKPRLVSSGFAQTNFAENKSKGTGKMISATTLKSLINKLQAKGAKRIAIKCDCEGEEIHLFDNVDLKNVYAMQMECHNYCKELLSKKLKKAGFRITTLMDTDETGSSMIGAYRSNV